MALGPKGDDSLGQFSGDHTVNVEPLDGCDDVVLAPRGLFDIAE